MPGLYLLAIVFSGAGMAVIDARFRLALWRTPLATVVSIAVGVLFFLAWDVVGILTGVFFQGDSPLYIGISIAPELPIEEVFFLTFLCYLAVLFYSAAMRLGEHRARRRAARDEERRP
ncbi:MULTISPECIES: lycopene cyclase domain-containing protein [unclassified Microbacterium]|uniref:lycopene cyclase domain-containing protein n=1 Tax=unclassified Microbacterium TaxID=2609290 RepID=UPI000F54CD6A|nr:lycopene cyclase domain-containing protein [Microbacterium sp. ABRD28]AZC14261.1 lycopene cyclase domain-containing protein [Microbacterium sp. ABRD28]